MRFHTTHAVFSTGTSTENARLAARKIRADFEGFSPALVIFFASTAYDPVVLAAEMHDAFPGIITLGCTTAGEGVDDKILNYSVVAMGFSSEVFDFCGTALVLGEGQKTDGKETFPDARAAMEYFRKKLGHDLIQLNYREYVGFMLADRISSFTEEVIDDVGEITDVLFIGGFSGDDYLFTRQQYVFYNGRACQDATVLCLWKPRNGFSLLKTQAVDMTDKHLVITKADEENRIIWEFNNEDAATAYARCINTPVESMDILDFDENPLAFTADGEPYLRAVVKQVDGRGLQMFARVREGTRQTVTHAGDVLRTTRDDLNSKRREMGGEPAAILHINCASRHTALQKWHQVDSFAKLFGGAPSISFSSYGEIYVGLVAMTSTMILFK